jgi:hypothetical protein
VVLIGDKPTVEEMNAKVEMLLYFNLVLISTSSSSFASDAINGNWFMVCQINLKNTLSHCQMQVMVVMLIGNNNLLLEKEVMPLGQGMCRQLR